MQCLSLCFHLDREYAYIYIYICFDLMDGSFKNLCFYNGPAITLVFVLYFLADLGRAYE